MKANPNLQAAQAALREAEENATAQVQRHPDLIAVNLAVRCAGAGSRVGLNRAFEKYRVVEPIERDCSNSS